jgi:hypothetical protein
VAVSPAPTPTPTPSTNVLGVIETILGDSTKFISLIAAGGGVIVAFASKFQGGSAEGGIVLAGIGVAGMVLNAAAQAIGS